MTARGRGPLDLDAWGVVDAVGSGRHTCADVLADAVSRSERAEPALGAVVTRVDRVGRPGGALSGVVTAVKELIRVGGAPWSGGAPDFLDAHEPANHDAPVVARLVAAGAGILATAASDPLGFDVVGRGTTNPLHGARVAGGSSGGPAAAVAAGLVHLALGTDTGGSVRIPAACCGIVGIKPTTGLLAREGVLELAPSLDTVGLLASTVADLALGLGVLTRRDPRRRARSGAHHTRRAARPTDLRVGVPEQMWDTPMDPDVRRALRRALDVLASNGVTVRGIDLPGWQDAARHHGVLVSAEAAALHGARLRAQGHRLPSALHSRLLRAAEVPQERVARAWAGAASFRGEVARALQLVDVICTPTLPCRIPERERETVRIGQRDEPLLSALTRLTAPWNLAGNPAGTIPVGSDRDGLPVSLQLVAAQGDDDGLLDAMTMLVRLTGPVRQDMVRVSPNTTSVR